MTLRLLDGTIHTQRRRPRRDYQTEFRDLRREPRPARDAWRAPATKEDDPKEMTLARARARPSRAKRAGGQAAPPRAGRVPPQVRDPVRLRRLRAGRRAARHRSRRAPCDRAASRQPGGDLRLLHPALGRAGLRRAGHACPPGSGSGCPTSSSASLGVVLHAPRRAGARAASATWLATAPALRAALARPRCGAGGRRDDATRRGSCSRCSAGTSACEFLRTFALTMLAFVAIYLLADFFDRFDDFLQHDASAGAIAAPLPVPHAAGRHAGDAARRPGRRAGRARPAGPPERVRGACGPAA